MTILDYTNSIFTYTVVDPHIPSSHVEAVGVEGREVDDAVMVLVSSPSADLTVTDLQPVHPVHPERPVRRVEEEEVLHQNVGGVLHVEEPGPVLAPDEVADAGYSPPDLPLAVQSAHPAGGEGHVVQVEEVDALQDVP